LISCFNFFAISIAGLFTGGQINPSATIGLYFAGKVSRKRLPVYIVSQLIGAFLGVTLCKIIFILNRLCIFSTKSWTLWINSWIFTNNSRHNQWNNWNISVCIWNSSFSSSRKLYERINLAIFLYKSVSISSKNVNQYIN
jgi:glycerol uptake facilitator-like aquaporin